MLDTETKRRIDSARDILVGKIPDPKSQVEQITIALIYKFMNDMDAQVEELGGDRTFFTAEFEKYSWNNLMSPRLGGFEILNLYAEAIQKMNFNPNIPELFRDIFKNAFLPYRDPQTLKSFLKIIDDFSYDHSEMLGDAFEYLLSVLGSQGDAGQFRTPRHIIEFIAEVVDPHKDDKILDPACGTAGFLISAYKHIQKKNSVKSKTNLTPDERATLAENIFGYDISPDMVRLSLVNLYLHGFKSPKIYEYDTLTSQERWNEYADVILANPPFMSPKGGIRPHKRFSVTSKRSEVLFVDYMCEHLTPNGKAGIIVPEGIIFQSSNAYKKLREMLVNNYLYAVVSLPAGVFQPYSGVKTSILLIDKKIAKRTNKILFVKIENDGFGLGAQRRPIEKNDLPKAIEIIEKYKLKHEVDEKHKDFAHAVEKNKIAESGDWNLSGERYKINDELVNVKYELVELGEVVEVLDKLRKPITKSNRINGEFPYYGATGIVDYINEYIFNERLVLLGEDGAKWSSNEKTAFIVEGRYWVNNHAHVLRTYKDKLIDTYLIEVLNITDLNPYITGVTVPKLNQKMMKSIKIPLPPLEIQKEIVSEIEVYQKIIDGAKAVVDNYKPTIKIDPDWEMVKLGEVCEIKSGGTPNRNIPEFWNGDIPYIKTGQIKYNTITQTDEFISSIGLKNSSARIIPKNTIIMAMYGQGVTRGKVAILGLDAAINQAVAAIFTNEQNNSYKFLYYYLCGSYDYLRKISDSRGGNQGNLNSKIIKEVEIPLPPLEIQKQIVARIEKEQELVNANKELITIFEQKIKDKIGEVWGE